MSKKTLLVAIFSLLATGMMGMSGVIAQEKTTLRLWAFQDPGFNRATQAQIDAYMEVHPDVSIEMQTFPYATFIPTLQTAFPAKDEADILMLFGTWVCSYASNLAEMPAGLVDTSLFYSATMDGYTCDGKYYGIPQEFNLEYGAVLVNKRLFESAGLNYPPAWANWDEFVSDAQALTQTTGGQMTVAGYLFTKEDPIVFSFLSGILQRGGDYWNSDKTAFQFDTEEARATLQQMMDMVNAGIVDPVLFNGTISADAAIPFFQEQAAIQLIGPWGISYRSEFPDFGEFDYVPMPIIGDTPVFAADSGWGMTVSPNTAYSEIAWDFAKFATTDPDRALAWNITSSTIPSLRQLVEDESYRARLLEGEPWLAAVLPTLKYGRYIGQMPDRDKAMYEIIYPYILDMLQGNMTVDETARAIDQDTNDTFR